MADRVEWMIYGANGYTGHLVAVEARRRGLLPVLAGRRAGPIEALAAELGLSARIFDLGDARSSAAALEDIAVVAHCAGPFAATSAQMIDACLTSRTHYLDITGELDVFSRRAAQARGCAGRRSRDLPGRRVRRHPHRLPRRGAQGDAAGRNPPRSGFRRTHARQPWHRTDDGELLPARPARRPGAAERGDRGSADRAQSAARRLRGRRRDDCRHRLGRSGHRLCLDRHSQHRDLCPHVARRSGRQPRARLGTALARLDTRPGAAAPARGSQHGTLRGGAAHAAIPFLGRGAQCGWRAPHGRGSRPPMATA